MKAENEMLGMLVMYNSLLSSSIFTHQNIIFFSVNLLTSPDSFINNISDSFFEGFQQGLSNDQ